MGYFPLCVDLCGADVILIGEGAAARRKLEILLSFGAEVRLFSDSLADRANHPQIRLQAHSFEARDLDARPALVVAADAADAEWISALCRDRGIPVNVVDVPALCTFYFPSLINRGDLTVAVSTAGKGPAAAVYLRRKFEEQIPARTEEILDWAQQLRQMLRSEHPEADRKRVMRQAVAQAMELDRPLTDDEVLAILKS